MTTIDLCASEASSIEPRVGGASVAFKSVLEDPAIADRRVSIDFQSSEQARRRSG